MRNSPYLQFGLGDYLESLRTFGTYYGEDDESSNTWVKAHDFWSQVAIANDLAPKLLAAVGQTPKLGSYSFSQKYHKTLAFNRGLGVVGYAAARFMAVGQATYAEFLILDARKLNWEMRSALEQLVAGTIDAEAVERIITRFVESIEAAMALIRSVSVISPQALVNFEKLSESVTSAYEEFWFTALAARALEGGLSS